MLATEYAHLVLKNEVPYIARTRYKVIHIALDYLAYGWSIEEMHRQHPDLTKAQICSAMAYYYDHQEEIDRQIIEEDDEIQKLRMASKQMTRQELLARMKL